MASGPLIVGNNAAGGEGPIQTYDFAAGGEPVASFVPTGSIGNNGRGVEVIGNEVFYTELSGSSEGSDGIHVAPFNGGAGGADTRTLPNPRPGASIADLAASGGALYVTTGYGGEPPLQVFKLDPSSGAVLAGPINIGTPSTNSDGFTVLPNGNFLINNGDASCTYDQYDSSTGALISGTTIQVPEAGSCTGVDTDGKSLFFETDFSSFTQTDMSGTLVIRKVVSSNTVEDMSLIQTPTEVRPTTTGTTLSGENRSGESITVKEGVAVSDKATLSGENASRAGGEVTYKVYADSQCSTLAKEAGAVKVSTGTVPASEAETLAPGTYYWQATYSGDTANSPSKSACGSEVETVEPRTVIEVVSSHRAGNISLGSPFSVTATVMEGGVPQPARAVTFTVTGANPQSATSATDSAGHASFSYVGRKPGTDQIVVSLLDRKGNPVTSSPITQSWVPLPAPLLGKTVNVVVVSGVVFIKLPPGAHLSAVPPFGGAFDSLSKGVGFIPLSEARQIPVGSTLDTSAGIVELTTATAAAGKPQVGEFGAGIFTILQDRKQRGLVSLNVVNAQPPQKVCATLGKKAQAARRLSSRVLGRLNGNAHGKYVTRGQYSAATVRGTIWNVINRCDGTLTQVSRGVVSVRDFLRRKTITLHAGRHYLAKAR
ncbi:MAG TPA: Ig-like domain-containing protein [Solirubrobacteraceae bacterium]|jgi:hypothetical protein|nr:Ig-like domain-containing protein [Solirubrobacteraceae bacterium]